tara:strand:+ start:98 stop:1561 length:1464 start_codon:yes stop_codon:yes gene_type:complete
MRFSIFFLAIFLIFSCQPNESSETENFQVVIIASPGGSVSTNGGNYQLGDQFSVTAIPNDGYIFIGWSNGLIESEITITVTQNITITANFSPITYSFFENLSNINKRTSWYSNNLGFNKFYKEMYNLTNSGFQCIKIINDQLYLSDDCYGTDNEYFNETGGYIHHDFDKDGNLDLWQHFMKSPWPQNEIGKDFYSDNLNDTNSSYETFNSLTQIRTQLLADVTGDGFNEIVLFSSGVDAPPFPGDSLGVFYPNSREYKYFLGDNIGYMHSGALGDIDNDDDLDIITFFNYSEISQSNTPIALINDGNGEFQLSSDTFNSNVAGNYYTTQVFDINGDGYLDILYSGSNFSGDMGILLILYGDGNGNYSMSNSLQIPLIEDTGGNLALDIDFYDFNSDGLIDILLNMVGEGYNSSSVEVYINNGENFTNMTDDYLDHFNFYGNNNWIKWLHLYDVDYDGDIDIVTDGLFAMSEPLYWENIDNSFYVRTN